MTVSTADVVTDAGAGVPEPDRLARPFVRPAPPAGTAPASTG